MSEPKPRVRGRSRSRNSCGPAKSSNLDSAADLIRNPAQILGISPGFTTAVNCSGGALGNMVCPNNVIAVCATIGFKNSEGMVMRKVFPALLVLLVAEMIAAMLYVYVFFPGYYM